MLTATRPALAPATAFHTNLSFGLICGSNYCIWLCAVLLNSMRSYVDILTPMSGAMPIVEIIIPL